MFRVRPSLQQRLLIAPTLGLVLVVSLSIAYLWQETASSRFMRSLEERELSLLDQQADLLTRLSRQHAELFKLLHAAGNEDDGALHERGRRLLDELHATSKSLQVLTGSTRSGSEWTTFDNGGLEQVARQLGAYHGVVAGALNALSDPAKPVDSVLLKADQKFISLHESFARWLKEARAARGAKVIRQIKRRHGHASLLAFFGLFFSTCLLLMSFDSALRLSRRLRQHVASLNALGQPFDLKQPSTHLDELENATHAVEAFRHSLSKNLEHETALADKNAKLTAEIAVRQQTERELLVSKQNLEEKILERTNELRSSNEKLVAENEQRKSAEQRLSLYKQVIDSTDEAIVITDGKARIIEVNPAYEMKLGYRREELLGHTPAVVSSGLQDKDFYRNMWGSLTNGNCHWSGEIWNKTKHGEVRPFWTTINGVMGGDGRPSNYICLARDMSAIKKAEKELEQLAYFDVLTGLPNRALFDDRLRRAIAEATVSHKCLAVMYVDLDKFKEVNDTHGHATGDALLRQVARRLVGALRASDTVCRLGGDEFTVILPEVRDKRSAEDVAGKMVELLGQPFDVEGLDINIGGSIGVALYPDKGADAETIKKNADVAMYTAKENGRGCYRLFAVRPHGRDCSQCENGPIFCDAVA
jgi:diguanylate cyclase (GGDEF)-like protein/PAS domain S-box-containing protein